MVCRDLPPGALAHAALDALSDHGFAPSDLDRLTFTTQSNTDVAMARVADIGDLKFFSKVYATTVPRVPPLGGPPSQWRARGGLR